MPVVACRLLVAHCGVPAPGPGFGGEDEAAGPDDTGAGGEDAAVGLVADEAADVAAGDELAAAPPGLAELADDDPPEVHPATRAAMAETAAAAEVALMAPNRRPRPASFIQPILSLGLQE